jgi:hypothetical protein
VLACHAQRRRIGPAQPTSTVAILVDTLTQPTDRPSSMAEVARRISALRGSRRIEDVIARLLEIEREKDGYRNPERRSRRRLRRHPDGVACFNFMYLEVTEAVRASLSRFESPALVERLAVVFAEYYLAAYEAAAARAWVSKAWEPLFEERDKTGVVPLQFALAGMNAHINNDLPWALLQTWAERGTAPTSDSPEYRDFQRVNDILAGVADEVRATLESGLLRWLDRALGRFDDLVASVVIAKARSEAWSRATRWRTTFDDEAAAAHERHVGYESRLILTA